MKWFDRAILIALAGSITWHAFASSHGYAQGYHSISAHEVRIIINSAIRDAGLASRQDIRNAVRDTLNRCRMTGRRLEPANAEDATEWIADMNC